MKNALRVQSITDFEYMGEQLLRDQWQDCKSEDRIVAEFFRIIRRGRQMTKLPSYRVEF